MAEWHVKSPIDYSPNGDDVDRFAQKSIATFEDIYEKLNKLRRNGATAGLDDVDTSPFEIRIDTTTGVIYMRDAANKKWIELGSAAPFWGITPENIGAVADGGGMQRLYMGNDADKPTTDCKTHDLYFAQDTKKLYAYYGSDWHVFLSLNFKDMLDYEDYVVSKAEVATKGANKILRLDPETGKGDIDITGSADHMLGREIQVTPLHDTDVLAWSEEKQAFVNRPKDTFTEDDATYTGEPGKLARVNSDGKIHANLAGNADKIAGKTIAADSLKGGEVLAYDAEKDVFVNVPKDYIAAKNVTTEGEVGKIVRVNTDGTIHGDLTGNALKIGQVKVTADNWEDGEILAFHQATNSLVNEPRGAITGAAKSLILRYGNETLVDYNGARTAEADLMQLLKQVAGGTTTHLERLVGQLYLALDATGAAPDGYDALVVENFKSSSSEIDQSVTQVLSVVSGDDSVDVSNSYNLIVGSYYQLTDGESSEEVQLKSINISDGIERVIFMEPVKNQYHSKQAKLYRSTVAVRDGAAYGGGNTIYNTLESPHTFVGSDTRKELQKSVSFTNYSAFSISGAKVENGKLAMDYTTAYGVALYAAGNKDAGFWKRINVNGDDLTVADL